MKWPNTDAGLFNIWSQRTRINGWQVQTLTKYNIHKWCIFTITRFDCDMDNIGG